MHDSGLPGGGPPGLQWPGYDATWAFQLEPIGPEASQLTVRVRGAYEPTLRNGVTRLALGAAHEIMEAAQLRNIKRPRSWERAEVRDSASVHFATANSAVSAKCTAAGPSALASGWHRPCYPDGSCPG